MTTDMELAEIYDAAADYLEVHGHCTGTLVDETGAVCASGAICAVIDPELLVCKPFASVDEEGRFTKDGQRWYDAIQGLKLPITLSGRRMSLTRWNDDVAEDSFEVIDLFRNAAKGLRNNA